QMKRAMTIMTAGLALAVFATTTPVDASPPPPPAAMPWLPVLGAAGVIGVGTCVTFCDQETHQHRTPPITTAPATEAAPVEAAPVKAHKAKLKKERKLGQLP